MGPTALQLLGAVAMAFGKGEALGSDVSDVDSKPITCKGPGVGVTCRVPRAVSAGLGFPHRLQRGLGQALCSAALPQPGGPPGGLLPIEDPPGPHRGAIRPKRAQVFSSPPRHGTKRLPRVASTSCPRPCPSALSER